MRKALVMIFLILFSFSILLSLGGYSLVIGVSPETRELCMGPNDNATGFFYPSTDSEVGFTLQVNILSEQLEIIAPRHVNLNPQNLTEYQFYVIEPGEVGMYNARFDFCTLQDSADYSIGYCIPGNLVVIASEDCALANYGALNPVFSFIGDNKAEIKLLLICVICVLGLVFFLTKNKHK